MPLDFSVLGQEPINPATGLDFSILNNPSRVGTQGTNLDPSKYAKYIGEVRPEFGEEELNSQRAFGQSSGEQFGAFLNQAIVGEILGGTIESLGYLADIGDAVKVASGEEVELGNAITDFGKSLRTWSQETTPIYETAPGKFAPGNFSWWMSNGPSVASTLSMMIPAAGTVKGLSMLGKVAGITANLSKTAGIAATGISQAIVSRHIENLLEASGKYDELYARNLEYGLSEEEARQNASIAASDIYNKNWVMLAQDIPQYLLLGKTFGKASSKITRGVAKELGESGTKQGLKTAGRYFVDALSEGGEEAYQYIVSEKADDLAMSKIDPDYKPRQLQEFLKEDEMQTSFAMGMVGAGVFQAGGRAINRVLGNTEEKQRIQNIRSHGPTIKYYSEMIKDAEERNDFEAYEEARLGMVNTLAGKASEFGNLDILVNSLEQVMSEEATPETLEKYGLDKDDVVSIKKNFPKFIEDVKEVGKAYEFYSKNYDTDIASTLATLETSKVRLGARKAKLTSQLVSDINKLNELGYEDLSPVGKDIFSLNADLKAHDQLLSYIRKSLRNKDLTKENREYYTDALKKQEDIVVALRDRRSDLRKSDVYSKEDRDKDKAINLDSSLLTEVNKTNAKLKFSELAINKKDEAIKFAKEIQKKRKSGEKTVPQEPEPQTEQEVPSEEPVSETTHEVTKDTPEVETNVETKEYEPLASDIARRRKNIDPANLINGQVSFESGTLNEFFEKYESADAINGAVTNTGLIRKEGKRIYFYDDNSRKKIDVTQYADLTPLESKIFILGEPNKYISEDPVKDKKERQEEVLTENELEVIQSYEPAVEHPSSDSEEGAENIDKDTKISVGELELVYLYKDEKDLSDYLENPDNDISEAIGTFSIDYDNVTLENNKSLLNALKRGNMSILTQEQLDNVPIVIKLNNKGQDVPGKIFVPTHANLSNENKKIAEGKNTSEKEYNKGDYIKANSIARKIALGLPVNKPKELQIQQNYSKLIENYLKEIEKNAPSIRAQRTTLIEAILKGQIVTINGFRKDSGHKYNIPKKGAQNNIIKSIDIPLSEVRLGVALRGGSVYDKEDNVLQITGNPNGGNVYLYTDRTPTKEYRGIKLNKSKISLEHANIILNAFQQGVKSFKNKYEGAEVEGNISVGSLLNTLVQNGEDTVITDSKRKVISDKTFLDRLERNQLYSSKGFLHYGKNGKISLKNTTPEDRDNFVQYVQENFNYPISLGRLKEIVPTIKIGTTKLEEGSTFEEFYVKNNWLTTDVVSDKYGNVVSKPQVYVNLSNEDKLEITTTPKETDTVTKSSSVEDILNKHNPFTSTFYEGKRYLKQDIDKQIEQVRKLINRNIPIEVTDSFIQVVDATGSHLAFGQVKAASMQLYQGAEEGTGYHEAYHIVSLYYLTDVERNKIYDNASSYYNIDRKDERLLEETLAEEFRKYMLSEKNIAPKQKEIRNLFQRLYDFIINLFINPSTKVSDLTIDKLFKSIENGKYTKAKVKNSNLKKYGGYDYLRKVEGFSTDQVHNITNLLMYQMLTKNNIVKLEDINKLSLKPVIKYLEDIREDFNKLRLTSGISEEDRLEADRLYNVYDRILDKDNFEQFRVLLNDRLTAMNINRKPDSFEDTSGIDIYNIFVNDSGGSDLTKYDKESYESSGKDNLLANVKLFIATLPASEGEDPYTRMPIMTDYTEAYSKIMKDLHNATSFKSIIDILEQKATKDRFYQILLKGNPGKGRVGLLDAPDSFKNQFEIAVYMHRHNFVNVVVDKDGNHIFVDAEVSKAEKELAYEWGLNFYQTGKYINFDDTVNKDNITSIINRYNNDIKNPLNVEYSRGYKVKNYDNYIEKLINILGDLGINVTKYDLNKVILELSKDKFGNTNRNVGIHVLVNDTLFGIFGSKGILSILESGKLLKNQKPEEILPKDSKVIEFARHIITNNVYLIDDTVLGAENNTYYVYALPNYLTEYTKELTKDSELFNNLKSVEYNRNSQFLKQIEEGRLFELSTFASYREGNKSGKDYKKINDKQDFLLKLNALSRGLIPLPTLADKKSYYFYKGLNKLDLNDSYLQNNKYHLSDKVIDIFYGYAQDEQSRITKVSKEIELAKKSKDYSKLVINKHYLRTDTKGKPIFNDKVGGLQYQHFTDFNDKELNKADISKALRKNIIDTIEYAGKLGILQITKDNNGNITNLKPIRNSISSKVLDTYISKYGSETTAIYHIMAEFTLNTSMSVIETEKLLSGDPAYYKSTEDKIKRLNAIVAPGSKLIDRFAEGEFKDKRTYVSATIKSFKYNDADIIRKLAQQFATAYAKQNPEATPQEVENNVSIRLKPYTEIDVTDAQVYVTPAMYREMKIRMGEWEQDTHEEAYRALMSDTTDKDTLLKAQSLIMQPLKLVHFGQYFKEGEGIPVYDKMSVAVLFPDIVKGTLLEPLYNKMINDKIDMIKYDSAVKVGNTGTIDYFDHSGNIMLENLEGMRTFEQNFKYLRKQQVTDPHTTLTRLLGTQVKKVAMQNLRLNEAIYKIKGSNKKHTGKEIADMFSKSYATLSNKGRESVEKQLGIDANGRVNKEKLYNSLRKAAEQSNQPYNVIDSLYVDENSEPNIQLDTLLNSGWTESRMIAFITKNTIDATLPGTDLIQMSGGGLVTSNDSQLQLLDNKGRTEIKVSVSLFESIIPNYKNKTYKEKLVWLKKNWSTGFDGIGYRIPTQGQNSVVPFVIKEFLPEVYGNTVILPYGFTALTGSDFDIDKLFITKYNYYTVGDNVHKYQFYEGDENGEITDENTLKEIWKAYVLPKLVRRDNLIELKEKIDKESDKKLALLNAWNNDLSTETKIDITEELGIDTITQDVLNLVGIQMTYSDLEKYIADALKLLEEDKFIKENKGKDAYEINHKKSVENRLLDLMYSVLTNEEHILETKTPLDTFTEKLKDIAALLKDKRSLSMLEGSSPQYQLQVKNWYVGGGKGIGPFALNNVHHALTQITGYTVDGYDISGVIGRDGIAIVDWLSALINANVDIAKDPYIFHLNVNQDTYNMVNFLIRAGYGEQTFWLINQPAIKEGLSEDVLIEKAQQLSRINATKQQIDLRYKEIEDVINRYSNEETVLNDKELKNYIKEEDRDYVFYAKQAGISKAYSSLNKSAKKLSQGVLMSRIDNKGFGNTLGELSKFSKDFNKLMATDDSFNHLINNTFLKTLYENSIPFIRNMYSGLTIESTNGFDEIVDSIIPNYKDIEIDDVTTAVRSGIMSLYFSSPKGFNLKQEDVKNLFVGETSIGYRIRNLENTYPELKDNKLIKSLKPVLDIDDRVWFTKYISGDKNDKFMRDSYSEAWGDLLEHTDPNIRKLGEDLIYYSFYTSGFNRSLYSFYQDLPISKLKDRPRELTESFDEFIKDMLVQLNSFVLSSELKDKITKEAMKYLGSNSIEEYNGSKESIVMDGKIGFFKLNRKNLTKIGDNSEGNPIFQNLMIVKDAKFGINMTQYVGYTNNSAVYKVIPSSGLNYRGHKLYELGYEGSIFDTKSIDISTEYLSKQEGHQDIIFIDYDNKGVMEIKEEVESIIETKQEVLPTQEDVYTNIGKLNLEILKQELNNLNPILHNFLELYFKYTTEDKLDPFFKKLSKEDKLFIMKAIHIKESYINKLDIVDFNADTQYAEIFYYIKTGKVLPKEVNDRVQKSSLLNEYTRWVSENKEFIENYNTFDNDIKKDLKKDYDKLRIKYDWYQIQLRDLEYTLEKDILKELGFVDTFNGYSKVESLLSIQEDRLSGLPENIRNNQEVINASINMSKEEFNAIVEQIKKCN